MGHPSADFYMGLFSMTRNQIKGLAVFTMFCNHSAAILLKADTVLFTLCINIGYFTAPIMCWFLVEGYAYTHSKWQYGLRLLLSALISELPFQLAFHRMGNMLFTLFLCFLILFVREQIQNRDLSYLMQGGLVLFTGFCDWPFVAGIYTILFSISYQRSKSILKTFGIATLIFLFVQYRNVGVFDASVVLSGMSVLGPAWYFILVIKVSKVHRNGVNGFSIFFILCIYWYCGLFR